MSELKNQELPLHIQNLYEDSKRDDYVIVGSEVRMVVYELRKALNELKAKDTELAAKEAKIAELEQRCNTFMQGLEAEEEDCEALHAELAAKEARIAELTADAKAWKRAADDCAEQQLAVSEGSLHAQQGKPMDPSYSVSGKLNYSYQAAYEDVQNRMATESRLGAVSEALKEKPEPHPGNMYRDACYYPDEIDPLFARLRSIVEGK